MKQPKEITVRVERPFRMAGEPVEVGTVLTLEYRFAAELLHAQKVSRAKPAPVAEPMPAPKAGKTPKSEKPLIAAKGE